MTDLKKAQLVQRITDRCNVWMYKHNVDDMDILYIAYKYAAFRRATDEEQNEIYEEVADKLFGLNY